MGHDWNAAVDRLLSGFAHNANGRTVSLEGLVALVEGGVSKDAWLPLLRDEAMRLARHSGGLHALAPDMGVEPLDPRDLVALAARALQVAHIWLLPPQVDALVEMPVFASRTAYVRALVTSVLAAVPGDREAVIQSSLERRGAEVVLRLVPERPWQVVPLDGAGALVAPYAGRVSMSSTELVLVLPALR